jgi:hypothetical protein
MSLIQQQWIRQLVQLCFLYVVLMVTGDGEGYQKKQLNSESHPIRDALFYILKVLFYTALTIILVALLVLGACFVLIFGSVVKDL